MEAWRVLFFAVEAGRFFFVVEAGRVARTLHARAQFYVKVRALHTGTQFCAIM